MTETTAKFLRFLIVGSFCAALFFAVYFFAIHGLGLSTLAATLLTYVVCFGVGYVLQRNFAFRSKGTHGKSISKYLVLHSCGMLFVFFVTQWIDSTYRVGAVGASLFATGLAGFASFVISLTWVFVDQPK